MQAPHTFVRRANMRNTMLPLLNQQPADTLDLYSQVKQAHSILVFPDPCIFKSMEHKQMNSDTFQGQWKQLRGTIKTAFGKLTDDDLLQVDGNADKLQGILQTRYGYTKEQAQTEWHNFTQKYTDRTANAQSDLNAAAASMKAAADHVKDAIKR
jgi:uncharacterized protein YjbJ (UPF0337 family)